MSTTRTLIAGTPDTSAPPHRIPIASGRLVLVWGAAKLPDGNIVAQLYDYRGGVQVQGDDDPTCWRPCIYASISPGEKMRLDCGCRAGRLCDRHGDDYALRWWFEAARRDHKHRQKESTP